MTFEERDRIAEELDEIDKEIFLLEMKDHWNGADYILHSELLNKKEHWERM